MSARGESDMERFIARADIAHLRDKLAVEEDERQRQTLMRLLADQEAKLAELEKEQPKEKRFGD
jgi:hypothetical protein